MEQNSNRNNFNQPNPPIQQQPPIQMQGQPIKPMMGIQVKRTKSKFLTFCCALIPGAGQMYHGLLKRGLSMMLLFWGIIAVSVLLYIPVINFALPIVWFYSFFDAVNRINTPIDELRLIKDEYAFNIDIPKNNTFASLIKRRHLWIGWGLALVGVYSVLKVIADRLFQYGYYMDDQMYYMIRQILNSLPALLVPIICIFIGIKLLSTTTQKKEITYTPHNITED